MSNPMSQERIKELKNVISANKGIIHNNALGNYNASVHSDCMEIIRKVEIELATILACRDFVKKTMDRNMVSYGEDGADTFYAYVMNELDLDDEVKG